MYPPAHTHEHILHKYYGNVLSFRIVIAVVVYYDVRNIDYSSEKINNESHVVLLLHTIVKIKKKFLLQSDVVIGYCVIM